VTGDVVVPSRVLFEGFEQARQRFAAVVNDLEGRAAYFALFEALNWAVALDERIVATDLAKWQWRDRVADGDVVRGLRYARNRVHHDWVDALAIALGTLRPDTLVGPTTLLLLGGASEWRWRDLRDLPPEEGPDRHGGDVAYRTRIARRPPSETLDALARAFAEVV
jgi:hypothetical protein